MKKSKILLLTEKELAERMTNEDFARMKRIRITISTLLNVYKDIAKAIYNEDTDVDISDVLKYIEKKIFI